jgi:glutamyl-Q tRNA(Asp) synthetase
VGYVGRFAPSPTGPLHLGSLVTAVASYLHASQAGGRWLVRIEDIDPPREVDGAATQILRTLEAFDLVWDAPVLYQSTRLAAYRAVVETLVAQKHAFYCRCSRSQLRSAADPGGTGRYPGTCRNRDVPGGNAAVRVRVEPGIVGFIDHLQGEESVDLAATLGDYIVQRRDGLPAYHLAVVVDDALQGISTVVRGVDLLESTFAHLHLQRVLNLATPRYYHLPVVVNEGGQKLSKQAGAAAVEGPSPHMLGRIVRLLGLAAPATLLRERPSVVWNWALEHWSIERWRGQRTLQAT